MPNAPHSAARRQESEPPIYLLEDLANGEGAQSSRGQLEREGKTIEMAAQRGHLRCVRWRDLELRPGGAGSLDEQANGIVLDERFRRKDSIIVWKRQR
jgi:hypothetical protein